MSNWKDSVLAGTTAPLPAYTTGGSNTTLTATANGAFPAQDGVTLTLNDNILVKNELGPNLINCGGYTLTQVGTGTTPWILTRMSDSNSSGLLQAATYMIRKGTTQAFQIYYVNVDPITLGTTPITFASISVYFSNSFVGLGTSADPIDLAGNVVKGVVLNVPGLPTSFTTSGSIATGTGNLTKITGTATLSGGTVTVNTTAVTSASLIFLTYNTAGTSLGVLCSASITAGASFVINSLTLSGAVNTSDNSKVNWWIIN
ncbi:hypothetical protein ACFJIV_02745 [Mucilaginibacter sp. UC70_90]